MQNRFEEIFIEIELTRKSLTKKQSKEFNKRLLKFKALIKKSAAFRDIHKHKKFASLQSLESKLKNELRKSFNHIKGY